MNLPPSRPSLTTAAVESVGSSTRLVDAHAEHGAEGLGLKLAVDHRADLDAADAHIGTVGDAVHAVETPRSPRSR